MRYFLAAFIMATLAYMAGHTWAQEAKTCESGYSTESYVEMVQSYADSQGFEFVQKRIQEKGEDYLVIIARHRAVVLLIGANECIVTGYNTHPGGAAMRYFDKTLDELIPPTDG